MKEYTVTISGIEHTVQLSEEDAKAQGLEKSSKAVDDKARTVVDKARTAPNKAK